jgi:AP-1 complex subunit beta-1
MKPLLTSIDHVSSSVADDLEATVALVWILGEFCDVLPNGMEALDYFTSSFGTQEPAVQNAVMTALVKLFLRNPAQVEPLLTPLFESAINNSRNPDVRDRAFMYWRLLTKGIGIERMKALVHSAKPAIDVNDCNRVNKGSTSLSEVLSNLNTAAIALEKPAKSFVLPYGLRNNGITGADGEGDDDDDAADLPAVENGDEIGKKKPAAGGGGLDDIFGGGGSSSNNNNTNNNNNKKPIGGGIDDIFGGGGTVTSSSNNNTTTSRPVDPFASVAPPKPVVVVNDPFAQIASNNNNNNANRTQTQKQQASPLDDMFAPAPPRNHNNNNFDPFGAPNSNTTQQQQPKKTAVDDLFS